MVDIVDRETRSRMMSGIRSQDTSPELFLRRGLHSLGYRYRLHVGGIPGKPDLVFPKHGALIEVLGCFWHGHGCRYFKWPKSNQAFWKDKISSNKKRDRRNLKLQEQLGWRVLTVWECAVRKSIHEPRFDVTDMAANWLLNGKESAVVDENGIHHK
jgi:DNA mismatch endonuclease, patch repair protein